MTFTLAGSAAISAVSTTSPGQHRIASAPAAPGSRSGIATSDGVNRAEKSCVASASVDAGRRRVTNRTGFVISIPPERVDRRLTGQYGGDVVQGPEAHG